MFNKNTNMAKTQEVETSGSINIVGNGTQIIGELESSGDIRVDGKIKGNVNVKGKLVVGPTGIIEGEIRCKNADVSGKLEGKLWVTELLSLKSTAKIIGDIVVSKIAIEPGAIFTGTCKMDDPAGNKSIGAPAFDTAKK